MRNAKCETFLPSSDAPWVAITWADVNHKYFDDKQKCYNPPVGHLLRNQTDATEASVVCEKYLFQIPYTCNWFTNILGRLITLAALCACVRIPNLKSGLFCAVFKVSGDGPRNKINIKFKWFSSTRTHTHTSIGVSSSVDSVSACLAVYLSVCKQIRFGWRISYSLSRTTPHPHNALVDHDRRRCLCKYTRLRNNVNSQMEFSI